MRAFISDIGGLTDNSFQFDRSPVVIELDLVCTFGGQAGLITYRSSENYHNQERNSNYQLFSMSENKDEG